MSNLADNISMNPPAGSINGTPLGTGVGMPVTQPFGAPIAKGFIYGPRSIKPVGFQGHIKPPSRSVKPKSSKTTKRNRS